MNKTNFKAYLMLVAAVAIVVGVFYTISKSKEQSVPAELTRPNDITVPATTISTEDDFEEHEFDDGLGVDESYQEFELDETGAGIASTEEFDDDINGDGVADYIKKTLIETGNAHSRYEYQVKINTNGKMIDVTPENLFTIEGADCALQKIQFNFEPKFQIIKVSRPMGETMLDPTNATRTVYEFKNNKLVPVLTQKLGQVCDVAELFVD